VLAETSAGIAAAMQPDGDPARRQQLFERWISALGLPLKDEVNALEISRFVSAGKSDLLLLETPEALDFAEEIRVQSARRRSRRNDGAIWSEKEGQHGHIRARRMPRLDAPSVRLPENVIPSADANSAPLSPVTCNRHCRPHRYS
jgi:hypothetical protein